jgi:hypothetical protein
MRWTRAASSIGWIYSGLVLCETGAVVIQRSDAALFFRLATGLVLIARAIGAHPLRVSTRARGFAWWITGGLVAATAADVCSNPPVSRLTEGLAAWCVVQVCYIYAFRRRADIRDREVVFPLVVGVGAVWAALAYVAERVAVPVPRLLLALYAVLELRMLWSALLLRRSWIGAPSVPVRVTAGAVLFVLSDCLIVLDHTVAHAPLLPCVVLTYLSAQRLMADAAYRARSHDACTRA